MLQTHSSQCYVAASSAWSGLWEELTRGYHMSDIWAPEEWQKAPAVKEVRTIHTFLGQQAVGKGRIVALPFADTLTREVANTLLKVLEEPPVGARIILFGETDRMLPTIRSRVQVVHHEGGAVSSALVGAYQNIDAFSDVQRAKDMLYLAPLIHSSVHLETVLEGLEI